MKADISDARYVEPPTCTFEETEEQVKARFQQKDIKSKFDTGDFCQSIQFLDL